MNWQCVSFEDLGVHGLYDVMVLRQQVFVVEQACPYRDADGYDQPAMHLLGRDDAGDLRAYCRIFAPGVSYREACIGRVVTCPSIRGSGMGRPLMHEAIRVVGEIYGPVPIKISAQAHLTDFYTSVGFSVCGQGYLEDEIPHLPMKRLAPSLT